jgi:hypothetical protein
MNAQQVAKAIADSDWSGVSIGNKAILCKAVELLAASASAEPEHPDDAAVDRFARAMKEKMAASRAKGRGGWQVASDYVLSRMLREHVEKGDPRDVANFCMMLWNNEAPISKEIAASASAEPVALWVGFLPDGRVTAYSTADPGKSDIINWEPLYRVAPRPIEAPDNSRDHGFESVWNRARCMDETPKAVARFIWNAARADNSQAFKPKVYDDYGQNDAPVDLSAINSQGVAEEARNWLHELRRAHTFLDEGKPFFSGKDCAELADFIEALCARAALSAPASPENLSDAELLAHFASQSKEPQ